MLIFSENLLTTLHQACHPALVCVVKTPILRPATSRQQSTPPALMLTTCMPCSFASNVTSKSHKPQGVKRLSFHAILTLLSQWTCVAQHQEDVQNLTNTTTLQEVTWPLYNSSMCWTNCVLTQPPPSLEIHPPSVAHLSLIPLLNLWNSRMSCPPPLPLAQKCGWFFYQMCCEVLVMLSAFKLAVAEFDIQKSKVAHVALH